MIVIEYEYRGFFQYYSKEKKVAEKKKHVLYKPVKWKLFRRTNFFSGSHKRSLGANIFNFHFIEKYTNELTTSN